MNADELRGIRERAEAATEGEWFWEDGEDSADLYAENVQEVEGREFAGHPWKLAKCPKHGTPYAEYWPNEADASHIAGMDPETTLKVLDHVDDLERRLDEAKRLIVEMGRG